MEGRTEREKSPHHQGIGEGCSSGGPDAEGRHIRSLIFSSVSQAAGDEAGSSDAEKVREAREEDEKGHAYVDRRHLVRVTDAGHEVGVRYVVDDVYDLADDRGDHQGEHSFGYLHIFEEICVRFCLFHYAGPMRVNFILIIVL